MANEIIDLGFLAAKVATLNNESAKMAVDSVSLVYNAAQIANFRNSIVEYQQILGYVSLHAQMYGVTPKKLEIATQCRNGINYCQAQINKHGTLAVVDAASILFNIFTRK